jgi:sugar phosphate isomerase/epimerase
MAKFSLQTFTIRKYLKDRRKLKCALKSVKEMGISVLEVARVKFEEEKAKELKELCDSYGLTIGSSQIKFDIIKKRFEEIVKIHKIWNCSYIAVSVIPYSFLLKGEDGLKAFAAELDALGERLRKEGLYLLFHHHHFEFLKYKNKLGMDILMEYTEEQNVGLVIDTYWVQRGGKTPHEFIEKYKQRVKVVHMRDYKIKFSKFDLLPSDCEIGRGNLDFQKIVKACVNSGVEYMAIEQDSKTPFVSIKKSVNALKVIGFERLF